MNHILDCAIAAAQAGAAELASRFGGKLDINSKTSPEDAVTDADIAAEKKVREVITSMRPDDSITGEELEAHENANAKFLWSIDPLDGTVNYTRGLPFFATSVAAFDIQNQKWVAGAVVAPALDLLYFASAGQGAYKKQGEKTRPMYGPPRDRQTKIIATGFSYSATERAKQFEHLANVMPNFVDVRRLGSAALDACLVADGSLDVYYERHIKQHDWAAALLIAEEAGQLVKRPEYVGDFGSVNYRINS